jgi:basic membrane protein A and related proteins
MSLSRRALVPSLAVFASCVGPWPEPRGALDEARVAFVYPGAIGDHGWTKAHDDGRLFLQSELDIETAFDPLVAPADAPDVIDALVADGWNTIFTVSSDFISATQQAAVDHPDTYFLSCCGTASAPNLNSYFGRMYQALYLSGYTAARMSCTGRLGVVAAKPSPEFVRHINAIALGAQLANPNAVVDVRWIDAFFDPELEEQYTNDLIDEGADVILTQTDTTVPVETAEVATGSCRVDGEFEDVPVYSVGYDNVDGCLHGPERCLTSAYWHWGPLYVAKVRSLLDGSWDPSDVTWQPMTNASDSAIGLADLATFIPAQVRADIGAVQEATVEGSTQAPFAGPLRDVYGAVRVEAGDEMDDEALDRMCWHVDGVIRSETGSDLPAEVPTSCVGDF